MQAGDRVTLRIEKAIAGGRMLARHDGAVVLVAAAIPGETVEAEIEKIQRGTIWATARHVIDPSADRVAAFCDWTCGGSVYAHVRYERQRELKRDVLRDAFSRLAHVTLDADLPVAASRPEGYRMRARLHHENGRLGFFREGTHQLCDASATRQLLPETFEVLARLGARLKDAPRVKVSEIEVAENCEASDRVCHLELDAESDPSRLAALTALDGLTGMSCGHPRRSRALTLWGSPTVTDRILGAQLTRHARAFFQGNRFLLSDLVTRVVASVREGPTLDLYAGVGLFSAALATRGGEVTAIEGDAISAQDLKRNAAAFGSAITARHQPVEAFLASRRPRGAFATAIVDPPRTGMTKAALEGLVALGPGRIVYVSCDVATLARDTRTLMERGYGLASLEAFDMFPNTAHVESLAIVDIVN